MKENATPPKLLNIENLKLKRNKSNIWKQRAYILDLKYHPHSLLPFLNHQLFLEQILFWFTQKNLVMKSLLPKNTTVKVNILSHLFVWGYLSLKSNINDKFFYHYIFKWQATYWVNKQKKPIS
jgi:hypothetical protein